LGNKSLEPGINWLLTAGFRLELPRKPEPFFFFLEPKPQVLHKSKELPNTGSNPIKSIIRIYYCIKFFFVLTS
jgi:hypothetical protein